MLYKSIKSENSRNTAYFNKRNTIDKHSLEILNIRNDKCEYLDIIQNYDSFALPVFAVVWITAMLNFAHQHIATDNKRKKHKQRIHKS